MDKIIVSRHAGAIKWLQEDHPELINEASVKAEVSADDVVGKVVVGNVPMHLACLAASVLAIEFAGAPPRGAEFSADDMRAAGARLTEYTVRRKE